MSQPVAVIGLGLMGGTFANNLIQSGFDVRGFDPDPAAAAKLQANGGSPAKNASEAVTGCSAALLSLPNSTITVELCQELSQTDLDGLVVVDTTTGDPDDAITAAKLLADAKGSYVDATVSGNAAQAAEAQVIFMAGGSEPDVEAAKNILEPLSRNIYRVGPVGSGARAKLVVNHVLSINRLALAEGLTVAEKAGIDLSSMLAVLTDSAAYSRAIDLWGQRMVDGDHDNPNSRITQNVKDSVLINNFAASVGAPHELVSAVGTVLSDAAESGLADADNSSVIEVLRRQAGIGRVNKGVDQ